MTWVDLTNSMHKPSKNLKCIYLSPAELMAEAVRQGSQTNNQQTNTDAQNNAEQELTEMAAQATAQEQTQAAQDPVPVSKIQKPEAEPTAN